MFYFRAADYNFDMFDIFQGQRGDDGDLGNQGDRGKKVQFLTSQQISNYTIEVKLLILLWLLSSVTVAYRSRGTCTKIL